MGYYKIALGKLGEGVNLDEHIKNIMPISLNQAKDKKELQQEYDNGRPILFNVIKKANYIFLYIAMKKGRKRRKIDWDKYNIEETKEEDVTSSQVILYTDGLIFIELNNKFPIVLEKLNEVVGKVSPYEPTGKIMKKFYEEAEEVNYMKLINVGKSEPNPHPEEEFTDRLVRSTENTDELSAHSKHGNIKRDKLMNALEKYSTPVELSGKKIIDDNLQKFSINIKKKTRSEEIFYSVSIKKPREESPENFEKLARFVKKVISSI